MLLATSWDAIQLKKWGLGLECVLNVVVGNIR